MTTPERAPTHIVILIDDDPEVREVLTKLLIEYHVVSFPTGDKAVEWLKNNPTVHPDYVMSDCILPGMNGIETLKSIRTIAPDSKLILMSAAVPDELEQAVLDNKFDGFIANPFTATEGNAMIQNALSAPKSVH
jgi:two-component system alkaline phosphatase synthesis response regulator PhoP